MTPFLDVPFLPEEAYVEFLNRCGGSVDSVYFSLPNEQRLDNRSHACTGETLAHQIKLLKRLAAGHKRYLLLNSRFYGPALLTDQGQLRALIKDVDQCVQQGVVNGLVYSDHFLLQALSNTAPDLAAALEAVPSLNTMLDSQGKIEAHLAYIGETRFRQPGRLILDRALNRNLPKLAEISAWCRQALPDVRLEVVGNEGCLPWCPYRSSHDAYIALDHCSSKKTSETITETLGCRQLLKKQPYRILQSPFIRPEDIDSYLYDIDIIKISGRNLTSAALMQVITAYIERHWNGNLLELLDSSHWLAEELHVDNSALSFDFANMLSVCNNRCETCRFCMELFQSISHTLPPAAGAAKNK
jgi:collagenase-like PrtC family protease